MTDTFPLSLSQRAVLDLVDLAPDLITNPHYSLSAVFHVRGPLDLDRLGDAADALVARQDVLRTRCTDDGGTMVQQVLPHRVRRGREALTVVAPPDGCPPDEAAAALAAAPVRWDEPPVLRVLVQALAPDEHLVAVVVHHLSVDATSLHLAVAELADGYTRLAHGRPPPAPPALRYGDYAAGQATRVAERAEQDREAWTRALAGASPPTYRRHHPFDPERPVDGRVRRTELLDATELAALDSWTRRHRSTCFSTLLAAFVRALATTTDDRDLLVLTVFEQRDHPAVRDLVGAFIHPTLVRVAVADGEPWDRLVARTRDAVIAAYGRAQVPFEDQLATNLALFPGAIGLAEPWLRFFEYLPARGEVTYRFGPAVATPVESSGHQLLAQERGVGLRTRRTLAGTLAGRLSYDAGEITDDDAGRLVETYRHLLRAVTAA